MEIPLAEIVSLDDVSVERRTGCRLYYQFDFFFFRALLKVYH